MKFSNRSCWKVKYSRSNSTQSFKMSPTVKAASDKDADDRSSVYSDLKVVGPGNSVHRKQWTKKSPDPYDELDPIEDSMKKKAAGYYVWSAKAFHDPWFQLEEGMPDVPMAAWELAESVGEVSMQSSIPHKELWAMCLDACEAAYQVDDGSEGEHRLINAEMYVCSHLPTSMS